MSERAEIHYDRLILLSTFLKFRYLGKIKKSSKGTFCSYLAKICYPYISTKFLQHFIAVQFELRAIQNFKGTVQRDFHSVFWHLRIGLGLNKDRFWFKKFSEAPTILDRRKFSSRGWGENVSKKLYFSEKFYEFISGFPGFSDVPIGPNPFWKPADFVIKLFWKPISKTERFRKAANKLF